MAYVFLAILPELAERQGRISFRDVPAAGFLEHHLYLLALTGLLVFYSLERMVRRSRRKCMAEGKADCSSPFCFWVHMGSFAAYNAVIGLLIHDTVKEDVRGAIIGTIALAMHFVVNDHSLRDHHKTLYDQIGRWMLGLGVLIGAALGHIVHIDRPIVLALWGFIIGGMILNVLKEEVPHVRDSCLASFVTGAIFYAAILLLR